MMMMMIKRILIRRISTLEGLSRGLENLLCRRIRGPQQEQKHLDTLIQDDVADLSPPADQRRILTCLWWLKTPQVVIDHLGSRGPSGKEELTYLRSLVKRTKELLVRVTNDPTYAGPHYWEVSADLPAAVSYRSRFNHQEQPGRYQLLLTQEDLNDRFLGQQLGLGEVPYLPDSLNMRPDSESWDAPPSEAHDVTPATIDETPMEFPPTSDEAPVTEAPPVVEEEHPRVPILPERPTREQWAAYWPALRASLRRSFPSWVEMSRTTPEQDAALQRLDQERTLLERIRQMRIVPTERKILLPSNFATACPRVSRIISDICLVLNLEITFSDEVGLVSEKYKSCFSEDDNLSFAAIQKLKADKDDAGFLGVSDLLALGDSFTNFQLETELDPGTAGRVGSLYAAFTMTKTWHEQVHRVSTTKQGWWKGAKQVFDTLHARLNLVLASDDGAKAVRMALELVLRAFIRALSDEAKAELENMFCKLTERFTIKGPSLLAAVLPKRTRKVWRTTTRKAERKNPEWERLPPGARKGVKQTILVDEKVREKVDVHGFDRPDIIEGPMTATDAVARGLVNRTLTSLDAVVVPDFSYLNHYDGPLAWREEATEVVARLRARIAPVNQLLVGRKEQIRSEIRRMRTEKNLPLPITGAGGQSQHGFTPGEWTEAENSLLQKKGGEWETSFNSLLCAYLGITNQTKVAEMTTAQMSAALISMIASLRRSVVDAGPAFPTLGEAGRGG
jgi:hypothetical protein